MLTAVPVPRPPRTDDGLNQKHFTFGFITPQAATDCQTAPSQFFTRAFPCLLPHTQTTRIDQTSVS